MAVHAVAVVAVYWLWHERRRLAGGERRVLDRVLEDHQIVGGRQQRVVAEVDFTLTAGCNFVMMTLNRNSRLPQQGGDFGSQVRNRIQRRQRHVTLLRSDVIAVPVRASALR